MSYGTQLDLFEPIHAIDEVKSALKQCSDLISDIQSFSHQQQNALSRLYLELRTESENHAFRVLKMEQALNSPS